MKKKLTLNKMTIADLKVAELRRAQGGRDLPTDSCDIWCSPSTNCPKTTTEQSMVNCDTDTCLQTQVSYCLTDCGCTINFVNCTQ